MRPLNHIAKLILILLLFGSCTGERYNVLHEVGDKETAFNFDHKKKIPVIEEGQELCIAVTSLNEESAKYFRTSKEREGATGIECVYYNVDEDGAVTMPLVGAIHLQGLTLEQAEQAVADTLAYLLKEPQVRIEYVDFHVSVLGEVSVPGVYQFNGGRVTLFEAIAKAQGITQFGRRENVLIIRETEKKLKHIRIDLTTDEVWNTDYYYLHHNDVVMIESNSGRMANSQNVTAYGSILVGLGTIAAIIATR